MARRKGRIQDPLDDHEGLSYNQARLILVEFGLGGHYDEFVKWMDGQTGPIIKRGGEWNKKKEVYEWKDVCGIYEYDLFRFIDWKKKGVTPVWD